MAVVVTAPRPPVNPFRLPGWEHTPMRPLRPFDREWHRDYYVPVDGTDRAFREFQREMGDLTGLLEDGRLVLVTGESGCGKTALVNRCADWVVEQLAAQGLRGVVLDMTGCLPTDRELSIDERVTEVCDQLFDLLVDHEALRDEAEAQLAAARDVPRRLFPRLGRALREDTALVLLLPSPNELVDEVIRYARVLRSAKVLYLAESAFLGPDEVSDLVRQLETWVPPVTLCVGPLDRGDAQRFAVDRLKRHAEVGTYPRMSDEAIELVANLCQSVAMLQRFLHGTYEQKLESGLSYTEADLVSVEDIRAFFNTKSRNGLGIGP
ncbi:ATP-binding protein [Saccharothrix syringae]|uniref:ATP-binding protein n=1 Tax=Saccharothrix syringae TaxID=103733 RepID=A0A5Q0H7H5_SACSY|nr:ATP-binding protein [Saccharothrix syringae]QFZ22157.1 ATP-binding protein [Saccharothrix syringae]